MLLEKPSNGALSQFVFSRWNLVCNALIGLGIAALAAGLLEWWLRRRRKSGEGSVETKGEEQGTGEGG